MQILCAFCQPQPDLQPWQTRGRWEEQRPREETWIRDGDYQAVVGHEKPGEPEQGGLHRQLAELIMSYRAFPDSVVTPQLARSPVQTGDTVGTRYHLIPGVDLFFASRVVETFDEPLEDKWRTGFTYSTIVGHPVMGSETFTVEKDLSTGDVSVSLKSWSQPITPLARLFVIPCRLLQKQAARAAIRRLSDVADRTKLDR